MIAYELETGERVAFDEEALLVFEQHRQSGRHQREAGGQLFGLVRDGLVEVVAATGPRRADWRTRFGFRPSRRAERREIKRMHELGLHYLGDWHTHPEPVPKASSLDLRSIGETARLSKHAAGPLLLVVVGTARPPDGLFVCLHDGSRCSVLRREGEGAPRARE